MFVLGQYQTTRGATPRSTQTNCKAATPRKNRQTTTRQHSVQTGRQQQDNSLYRQADNNNSNSLYTQADNSNNNNYQDRHLVVISNGWSSGRRGKDFLIKLIFSDVDFSTQ